MARKSTQAQSPGDADAADAFDIEKELIAIVRDPASPGTAKVSAIRLLIDLQIAAENRASMAAAGLD